MRRKGRKVLDRREMVDVFRDRLAEVIRQSGGIDQSEMDRTFNCGIGYTLVVPKDGADEICRFFRRRRIEASVIGIIRKGRKGVQYG